MSDWNAVLEEAASAAQGVIGSAWGTVGVAAQHSIELLVQTAAYIAANAAKLDTDEQNVLINNQKLAMQNVLLGYEDIGIVVAEQAVAAAWNVIEPVLLAAIKI